MLEGYQSVIEVIIKMVYFPRFTQSLEPQPLCLNFPNSLASSKKNNHLRSSIADNKTLPHVGFSLLVEKNSQLFSGSCFTSLAMAGPG